MKKRHQQKLVILSVVLVAAFNIPVILIFDKPYQIAGIPLVYLYIFVVWVLSIVYSLFVIKRHFE